MERKESFQHPDESLKAKRDAISQKNHLKSVITNQKLMTMLFRVINRHMSISNDLIKIMVQDQNGPDHLVFLAHLFTSKTELNLKDKNG